jgi:hypothetical protein
MWLRVENARQDSDAAFFMGLMHLGEMLTKLVVAGKVAAVADDSNRHRYGILHRLVRADGLGDCHAATPRGSEKRVRRKVRQAKKRSPRAGNPNAPGRKAKSR